MSRKTKKVRGVKLRVIGGDMRGRTFAYHGESFTRPMKDKIRESLFNILGQSVRGARVADLFAGTGALAIEALSRKAEFAVAIEPNARASHQIRKSLQGLGLERRTEVITGDAFRVAPRLFEQSLAVRKDAESVESDSQQLFEPDNNPGASQTSERPSEDDLFIEAIQPWIVFFCPPYVMWKSHQAELNRLIAQAVEKAPPGSRLILEAEKDLDTDSLPGRPWDIRSYGNTVIAIHQPANVCGLR